MSGRGTTPINLRSSLSMEPSKMSTMSSSGDLVDVGMKIKTTCKSYAEGR